MQNALVFAAIVAIVASAGCVSQAAGLCGILSGKNQDECIQRIAVSAGDPTLCERIQAEDFKAVGSKPPRDKCYLMIAENTEDKRLCDKIVGGMYSYSKQECLDNIRTGKHTT